MTAARKSLGPQFTHFFIKTVIISSLILLPSCKKRHYSERLSSKTDTDALLDFCMAVENVSPLWNAARVQNEIQKLIDTENFKESGLSAYAETYKAMTAQRDLARCQTNGALAPTTPHAGRINSVLADLMSKGFVLSQAACIETFRNSAVKVPNIGAHLCEISYRASKEHWTALELSMGSTAVYLTSVMGIAVSALPHIDSLWETTRHNSLEKRIAALQQSFKPTFDSFNEFLSDNLHTVAQVLLREKRIDCRIFEIAARALGTTKAPTQIFKDIRDETFRLGLDLAKQWPLGLHPMTAGEAYWKVDKVFGPFAKEPQSLRALYEHGNKTVEILKNPLLRIFRGKDTTGFLLEQGLSCEQPK